MGLTNNGGAGVASLIGIGTQLFGANQAATGAKAAGTAAAQSDLFNASIAGVNAQIASRNASFAAAGGEAEAGISEAKTRALVGGTLANQGASGVRTDSGSAVNVRASEAETGMLDALTIRAEAAKKAYGYQTEVVGEKTKQAMLTQQAAQDVKAGTVKAQGTLLAGIGSAAGAYGTYLLKGGLNSSDTSLQTTNDTPINNETAIPTSTGSTY